MEDSEYIEQSRYQQEEKKPSKLKKIFGVLANILTFGIYGKIKQIKAEKRDYYTAGNSTPDEEAVITPVSKEDIGEITDEGEKDETLDSETSESVKDGKEAGDSVKSTPGEETDEEVVSREL